jgi:hypothetical protein
VSRGRQRIREKNPAEDTQHYHLLLLLLGKYPCIARVEHIQPYIYGYIIIRFLKVAENRSKIQKVNGKDRPLAPIFSLPNILNSRFMELAKIILL